MLCTLMFITGGVAASAALPSLSSPRESMRPRPESLEARLSWGVDASRAGKAYRLGATGASGDAGVAFPLTQADLGDACGLTSIHTNRAIQELRRAGLLDLSAGTLRIHDRAGLCTMASFDPAYLTVAAEEAEGDEAVGERRAAG